MEFELDLRCTHLVFILQIVFVFVFLTLVFVFVFFMVMIILVLLRRCRLGHGAIRKKRGGVGEVSAE